MNRSPERRYLALDRLPCSDMMSYEMSRKTSFVHNLSLGRDRWHDIRSTYPLS